jgi:hypothetical protein
MTLRAQIEYWRHRAEVAEAKAATIRSPRWNTVKKAHKKKEDCCQFCGIKENLEVHHIHGFKEHPEWELVDTPDNLITLCETKGVECHRIIGHNGDWSKLNPNVRADCEKHRKSHEA